MLVFIVSLTEAQPCLKITGRLIDSISNQTIPHAHIYLENTNLGTSSNSEGYFSLAIPRAYCHKRIIISCIGYSNDSISPHEDLQDTILNIVLSPSTKFLREVIVRPEKASEILRKVRVNLDQNYPSEPIYLTGFFRDLKTSYSKGPLYIDEALIRIYKNPYSSRQKIKKRQLKLIKGRRLNLYGNKHKERGIIIGDRLISSQVIDRITLENVLFRSDEYELQQLTSYNQKPVYKLVFEWHRSQEERHKTYTIITSGHLYIDAEPYAIVRVQVNAKLNRMSLVDSRKGLDSYNLDFEINYKHYRGKWYLQNLIWKDKCYDSKLSDTVNFFFEYMTTAIDTVEVELFSNKERFKYLNLFMNQNYELDFWDVYNTLTMSDSLKIRLGSGYQND